MAAPVVYGPAYSTYARTVRLALEEKGVDYKLEEVDLLQGAAQLPAHLARQPFGKVPAFEHDGFKLYETGAIARYIDEAFPGPKLQPADAKRRARMTQFISVSDSYAYPCCIGKVVWQRAVVPLLGGKPDEKVVAEAMPMVEKTVAALEQLVDPTGPFLCGPELSLADLHLAPVMAYFSGTPEGKKVLAGAPRLSRWWQSISTRPSVVKTQPKLG
ncbi:MAG TPA: glutathione S-transferase family protein [Candidatus Acidoferrum sp.]|nr:glutathione S-transferase family protein [Candidatus Acidoferrum sp.]